MPDKPTNTPIDSPRPSSLRALVAWFFVLSFSDRKDNLEHPADKDNDGKEVKKGNAPFERRVRQLIWWPPDIFALTSSVLSRTGAYRMIVGPHNSLGKELWQRLDWQSRVEAHAEAWRSVVSELILDPFDKNKIRDLKKPQDADTLLQEELKRRITDRCKRRDLEPLDIHSLITPSTGISSEENLIEVFLRDITELRDADGFLADQNLLAVSVKAERRNRPGAGDAEKRAARFFEAIIGLHILADAASESIGVPRSSTQESAVFDAIANIMLTLRGSLSTVSKFHGVVLPKMRTPQKGLTLRNLSHNLTFHDCEVEVMWRSFPWSNFDENTLNVLYVPYPFDFDPKRFKSDTDHYESVGYFTYDPGDWKEIGSVVELVEQIREQQGISPHMLVFTETAFNEDAYKRLLTALSQRYGSDYPQRMPVVVAGISKKVHGLPYNELRLATYFAGKWYQLAQHKHHRWQLDESQIRQYGLQGHLSTARPLFENSVVDQRRLTFYAPTPWLVLSPLICEDLSRIEPVSELIRGVGPTLVLALLLDGPQLAERWAGRYASVLADDPGTGVLTVTSYGAAEASRTTDSTLAPRESFNKTQTLVHEKAVVASWKDPSTSFVTLSAAKNQALLVTLTAHLGKEFTLDRRGVSGKAAGFRLHGVLAFDLPEAKAEQGIDTRLDLGNWSDIREVTALTYVASAALSLLRPHRSKHPEEAEKRTDTWDQTYNWGVRCQRVRQLIDVMLGRSVFESDRDWEDNLDEEVKKLKRTDKRSEYDYFNKLKAARNRLLCRIFGSCNDQERRKLVPHRHLFSVICFSQTTIDVEVRDEEALWPTDALRFGSIVLRVLLDSIAGRATFSEDGKEDDKDADGTKAEIVYRNRLKIAGRLNREEEVLWGEKEIKDDTVPDETDALPRDVLDAPEPLYSYNTTRARGEGVNKQINYLMQFKSKRGTPKKFFTDKIKEEPNTGKIKEHPNRYDFYRMVLELVGAILTDEEASLWKQCQKHFQGQVNEAEMRRLTLLVLMMISALIHEQLEFEYIQLKQNNEINLRSRVMHDLMKKSEEILEMAEKKTRVPWNPQRSH